INPSMPLMDRWKLVEPFWEICRHTGYGQSLDISAGAVYGIPRIEEDTIGELNVRFLESLNQPHFKRVLKDLCRIEVSLLHEVIKTDNRYSFTSLLDADTAFFRSMYCVDNLVFVQSLEEVRKVETESGIPVTSLDAWLSACEVLLENALRRGAAGLKSGLAYERSLAYERVTRAEAEEDFNELFKNIHMTNYLPSAFTLGKKFQDYCMHHLLSLANKRGLTFQFHTGIQEGNGNLVYHSDPSLLSPLFLTYRDVSFDLFHIGYPYHQVLGVLAKNNSNVFIDMCWAHIVSPVTSAAVLNEWLEMVPANKISAFGGDYLFVDGVYGHLELARRNTAKALAGKVTEGLFDLDRAREIARMLFYENPKRIFKL
ncbi:MAG: amidohydrolase, partial [Spirochaetales bacterium]